MEETVVYYHGNCADGLAAAWCVYKEDPSATFVACNYGDVPKPEQYKGKHIWVVDFSFSQGIMESMSDLGESFTWLDHHKTAFEAAGLGGRCTKFETDSSDSDNIVLDKNRSGAMITWEYLNPGSEIPVFIELIDDRDRWVFKYGDRAKFLHSALLLEGLGENLFCIFEGMCKYITTLEDYLEQGEIIHKHIMKQVEALSKKAERCVKYGKEILVVNSCLYHSELGNELANISPSGIAEVWHEEFGQIKHSLRSVGDVDVSVIAKEHGGGGHKNAAGYVSLLGEGNMKIFRQIKTLFKCVLGLKRCSGYRCYPDYTKCYGCGDCKGD